MSTGHQDDTTSTTHDPITLANVDDYLDHEGLFLPHHEDGGNIITGDAAHDHGHGHDSGPTTREIEAAMSNALEQQHDSSALGPDPSALEHHSLIDPSLLPDGQSPNAAAGSSTSAAEGSTAQPRGHPRYPRRMLSEDAVRNPISNLAPFIKPQRTEDSPHPEQILFQKRTEFETWLKGESSWCHYVQRRVTNPDKRAEERLKARIRAHERAIAAMTPEQAAAAPALKRRKRSRTSAVVEKVTYTCHHAGAYSAKHSETLPSTKLRMNTKQSVKCSCSSRIVLTEVEGGECQVMYYWKHQGHDPFASAELESGRMPKEVDDWLNERIRAGNSVEEIRAKLDMPQAVKDEYIRKATEDPSSIEPDMPPALALSIKIKYPDIYNRFRKIRGPVKENKKPREPRTRRRRPGRGDDFVDIAEEAGPSGTRHDVMDIDLKDHIPEQPANPAKPSLEMAAEAAAAAAAAAAAIPDGVIDPDLNADGIPPTDDEVPTMLHGDDVDHQFDEHLARLASDGQLAEALLQLPQGSGEAEAANANAQPGSSHAAGASASNGLADIGSMDDVEENLREAVLRMARAERDDWDSLLEKE